MTPLLVREARQCETHARAFPAQARLMTAVSGPLPSATPPPIAGWFVQLFLRSANLPPERAHAVLRRSGIDPRQLNASGLRVTEQAFTRFLILLARRARDEAWGIASRPIPPGTFHTLCR